MPRRQLAFAAAFAVAGVLLQGCASTPARTPDALCPALVAFANADKTPSVHSVELKVDWFESTSGMSTDCVHHGYGAGDALCMYLVQHSSREFPQYNIWRGLACMDATRSLDELPPYDVRTLAGEVDTTRMPGLEPDVEIRLIFDTGEHASKRPNFLRIEVERYPPLAEIAAPAPGKP